MKKRIGWFLFILTFISCQLHVLGQTQERKKLIDQSLQLVYKNPDESIKVANHILKTSTQTTDRAEAFHLLAIGNFIKGQYDLALQAAFESNKLNASLNNPVLNEKNSNLIAEILHLLQLNKASNSFSTQISSEEIEANNRLIHSNFESFNDLNYKLNWTKFNLENIQNQITKKEKDILANAKKVNAVIKTELPGFWEAKSLLLLGDAYFENQINDSASIHYLQALAIAQKLGNPFLEMETHEKLARNFLVIDDKSNYHMHNQKWLILSSQTNKLENNSASLALDLISQADQEKLSETNRAYARILYIILGICLLAFLLKVFLYFRNKSKLKTYQLFVNYLKKQEEIQTVDKPEIVVVEAKTQSLNKEIEEQILIGLRKFETSKRFTNKDMSLALLASQLNTNTRYLSEVINGHKNKNFNAYINELRINYITEKIKNDPNYRNYKVSYLAEECGFSSHSSFTTVFKSIVGVSPITFVEFVKNESKNQKLEMA